MKVRVEMTVDIDDDDRRRVAAVVDGRDPDDAAAWRLASKREVRDYFLAEASKAAPVGRLVGLSWNVELVEERAT